MMILIMMFLTTGTWQCNAVLTKKGLHLDTLSWALKGRSQVQAKRCLNSIEIGDGQLH